MFNRNSPCEISIVDPDDASEVPCLSRGIGIDNECLFFSEKAIFRFLSADDIDPEKTNHETLHSYEKLYSVGTSNSLVARMILQFVEIVNGIFTDQNSKNKILTLVWEANKILLECEKNHFNIYKNTMELLPICDKIIEVNKTKQSVPALPKVPNLNTYVESFLINSKKFLVCVYKLLHFFYNLPFTERNGAHFDKHRTWIGRHLGKTHRVYGLLVHYEPWVRILSECSNAIRHKEQGQEVCIENFALKPGNKASTPGWKYDLTKKGLGKQDNFSDLIKDIGVHTQNMLHMYEELLLMCLEEKIDNPYLGIFKIREEHIQLACPILYVIGFK
jgi:hypothetical protein